MKKLLVLLACLSMTGCFYQSTTAYEIGVGVEYCKDKGGLLKINSWFVGSSKIMCNQRKKDPIGSSNLQSSVDDAERLLLRSKL